MNVLTRNVAKAKAAIRPGTGGSVNFVAVKDWQSAIAGSYAVVNLAGEPISTRWTDGIKNEILSSRVNVTNKLVVCITIQHLCI